MVERAYGTPFFLEEMVRYLIESRAVQRSSAEQWMYTRSIASDLVPVQIERLLIARLDRLDEATMRSPGAPL